jgi:UDP-N-acetylmuramoyl-tripeptide--D-alanyl-D-alanine ligase
MGMSSRGEITRLSNIVRPDIAVITNIGISHIEKLGSKENILKSKMEVLDGMDPRKGVLILNTDDMMLSEVKIDSKIRTVFFGIENNAGVRAENISLTGGITAFDIKIAGKTFKAVIPVPGKFVVYNALAAIAAALELNIEPKSIMKGLSEYKPGSLRMNIEKRGGYSIINDAYNASPDSVKAAIEVLMMLDGNRKIAVLGDMLELGKWADEAHANTGEFAFRSGVDILVGVGDKGSVIADGAKMIGMNAGSVFVKKDNAEAAEFLNGFIKNGDVILIKGSRGMKMEKISENLPIDLRNREREI